LRWYFYSFVVVVEIMDLAVKLFLSQTIPISPAVEF
jgi:hypothetical protein